VQHADEIPEPPASLYLRPTLIGTEKNIGAAAAPSTEALLFVIASPVGDYFGAGASTLKLLIDDQHARTTEQLGSTKTGGNYASALGPTLDAKAEFGVDQVLFCPHGDVQETGAANFILISDDEVITKPLDSTFLHGITRDSILQLAGRWNFAAKIGVARFCASQKPGTVMLNAPTMTSMSDGSQAPVISRNPSTTRVSVMPEISSPAPNNSPQSSGVMILVSIRQLPAGGG